MVAVRTWGGEDELLFFMKPLSEGAFARRLELNKSQPIVKASEVVSAVFEGNSTTGEVHWYAATANSTIYIYTFQMIAETYSVDMRVDVHEDLTIDGK
jgi:hypothetical protein